MYNDILTVKGSVVTEEPNIRRVNLLSSSNTTLLDGKTTVGTDNSVSKTSDGINLIDVSGKSLIVKCTIYDVMKGINIDLSTAIDEEDFEVSLVNLYNDKEFTDYNNNNTITPIVEKDNKDKLKLTLNGMCPEGTYNLKVTYNGYTSNEYQVNITNDREDVTLNITTDNFSFKDTSVVITGCPAITYDEGSPSSSTCITFKNIKPYYTTVNNNNMEETVNLAEDTTVDLYCTPYHAISYTVQDTVNGVSTPINFFITSVDDFSLTNKVESKDNNDKLTFTIDKEGYLSATINGKVTTEFNLYITTEPSITEYSLGRHAGLLWFVLHEDTNYNEATETISVDVTVKPNYTGLTFHYTSTPEDKSYVNTSYIDCAGQITYTDKNTGETINVYNQPLYLYVKHGNNLYENLNVDVSTDDNGLFDLKDIIMYNEIESSYTYRLIISIDEYKDIIEETSTSTDTKQYHSSPLEFYMYNTNNLNFTYTPIYNKQLVNYMVTVRDSNEELVGNLPLKYSSSNENYNPTFNIGSTSPVKYKKDISGDYIISKGFKLKDNSDTTSGVFTLFQSPEYEEDIIGLKFTENVTGKTFIINDDLTIT